jgi:hypothetical protein
VRHSKWLAVAGALLIVAAACGGDDDDDDVASDTSAGETTTTAAGDTSTTADEFEDGGDTTTTAAGETGGTGEEGGCAQPNTPFTSTGSYTAPDGTETALEAGEIGVTADTITIAVYAAVDNPFAPGLAEGNRDGVYIWRDWINQNCGLAGRNVEVEFYDTKLDIGGTEFPAAQAAACPTALMFVGGYELFDGNVDNMIACPDSTGAATGMPDLVVVQGEPAHYLNPTTYSVIPTGYVTGLWDSGGEQYLTEQGLDLRGVFLVPNDLPSALNSSNNLFDAAIEGGPVTEIQRFEVGGREENYDPFTQALVDGGGNYARSGLAVNSTVRWRQNVAQLAPDADITWGCSTQCYDANLFAAGNDIVEGTYTWALNLPFEEADLNSYMQAYIDIAEEGGYKTDGLGFQAFVSALTFQEIVERIVEADGPNAITRVNLLDQLANLHDWDAHGLIGPTDIGGRVPSGCQIVMQAQGGQFVRVHPEEPGTFDCDPNHLIQVGEPQPVG